MTYSLSPEVGGRIFSLLPGEAIQLNQEERPVPADDFRIVTEQARYQVSQLPSLVRSNEWILNPDFQRRHRWDTERRSRLIESFILNVPIPPIFLYEAELQKFEVMDGLQRLSAIADFFEDEFPLKGLEFYHNLEGRRFSELGETNQRTIGRRYLSAVILLHETGKSEEEAHQLKRLVFERINSGGVDLTPQESRNALIPGPMNDACLELAGTPSFQAMWGIGADGVDPTKSSFYRNMYDVELVLRFFAYRQRAAGIAAPHRNLRAFLDSYLRAANGFDRTLIQDLKLTFVDTCDLVFNIYGKSAFWLRRMRGSNWAWIEEPAVVAYEPMMLSFSQRLERGDDLQARRRLLKSQLMIFYEENSTDIDGRKVNTSDVMRRNALFMSFLDFVLAKPADAVR